MSHANAALTPRARLRLAKLIVDDDWSPADAAKMFMVSAVTARKWAARYRSEGLAGMQDRPSRPSRCPSKTPDHLMRQIVRLRWRRRLGPVQIGGRLGLAPSTVHAVLVRCRINRLTHVDRASGERNPRLLRTGGLHPRCTTQVGALTLLDSRFRGNDGVYRAPVIG